MTDLRLNARAWSLLLALSVLWGGSFLFAKLAVGEVPPLTLVAMRVSLAALFLLVFLGATGRGLPRERHFWALAVAMGMLNNVVPFTLLFWAQRSIDVGLASILNATTPLWTIILAHGLTGDERLSARRLLGVAIGIAGVAIMVGAEAVLGIGDGLWPQLAVIGATLSYAFGVIAGRGFRGHDPTVSATAQLICASIIAWPIAGQIDRPWAMAMPGGASIAAVIALAVFSTALAYVIYFRLIMAHGAGNAAMVTMLIPPSAMIMGALFLGERPKGEALSGLAMIVLGLLIVDGRLATFRPRR